MVATSKLGLVWANVAMAVSARQVVSFLAEERNAMPKLYWRVGDGRNG
jgi:hypothetical protein